MALAQKRFSWKVICILIGIAQILLFAAFQAGFLEISKSQAVIRKRFKYQPLDISPKVSHLKDEYWAFEKPEKGRKGEEQTDTVDIHYANGNHKHAGASSLLSKSNESHKRIRENSIAMGLGITSFKSKWKTIDEIRKSFPFFNTLLPSFCETVSLNYSYNFFLGFDKSDHFFTELSNLRKFQSVFYQYIDLACPPYSDYSIHFVQCSHNKHPAWAQNDAMIAAYMSNIEYYYRINDDTKMVSPHWTEIFIKSLREFKPPNVGVVGPTHKGGNVRILTYDFVHYTHIEIHGIYYPHVFEDWHADRWITDTYKPSRFLKVKVIKLQHTLEQGQRYRTRLKSKATIEKAVGNSHSLVENFVQRLEKVKGITADKRMVISMTLYGRDPKHTYGAIRNLQLHRIYLPDWSVRIYVLDPNKVEPHFSNMTVPEPVLNKLQVLGAEIVYLNSQFTSIDPRFWRYLVADDETVNWFLIRDTHTRIDERFEILVKDWISKQVNFFCAREFTGKQIHSPLVPGLMGANSSALRIGLGQPVNSFLFALNDSSDDLNRTNSTNYTTFGSQPVTRIPHSHFITSVLQPIFDVNAKCYDNNDAEDYKNSIKFPLASASKANHTLTATYNQFEIQVN